MLVILLVVALIRTFHGIPTSSPTDTSGSSVSIDVRDTQEQSGTRALNDIILSCFATILACTWSAVHPNIPAPTDCWWTDFKRRVVVMVYALLAPEAITAWALKQRMAAKGIADNYNAQMKAKGKNVHEESSGSVLDTIRGLFQDSPLPQEPEEDDVPRWTLTHGFFLQMGGFMLCINGRPVQSLTSGFWNVKETRLEWNIKTGNIDPPQITEDDIKDRSKGDTISKTFVILQTTWFIAQCVARWSQHLFVTELEVVTLGFALLNGITYGLWWNKPQNVVQPVRLEAKKRQQQFGDRTKSGKQKLSTVNEEGEAMDVARQRSLRQPTTDTAYRTKFYPMSANPAQNHGNIPPAASYPWPIPYQNIKFNPMYANPPRNYNDVPPAASYLRPMPRQNFEFNPMYSNPAQNYNIPSVASYARLMAPQNIEFNHMYGNPVQQHKNIQPTPSGPWPMHPQNIKFDPMSTNPAQNHNTQILPPQLSYAWPPPNQGIEFNPMSANPAQIHKNIQPASYAPGIWPIHNRSEKSNLTPITQIPNFQNTRPMKHDDKHRSRFHLFLVPIFFIGTLLRPLAKTVDLFAASVPPGALRVPMFYSGSADSSKILWATSAIGVLFGSVHLVTSWFIEFPSAQSLRLWRAAAIVITVQPMSIGFYPLSRRSKSKPIRDTFKYLMFGGLPLYFAARIMLLTLSLISLRSLPPGAFQTVRWALFIPHL